LVPVKEYPVGGNQRTSGIPDALESALTAYARLSFWMEAINWPQLVDIFDTIEYTDFLDQDYARTLDPVGRENAARGTPRSLRAIMLDMREG
jgi:hypothetical protein